MIYLDNGATTKPEESVIHSFSQVARRYYANPSSIHEAGAGVEKLQNAARKQAAQLLGIDTDEVIFTSGGTEGNNLAIKGIALNYRHRGKHIITSEVEHASVYETVQALQTLGFEATFLPVDEWGSVNPEDVKNALRDDTILVSIMQVNNEIGTEQPIKAIGELLRAYPKVFLHVDAVQALGKTPVQLQHIDLCTFSGHKIHGLKGTGMLYMRKGVSLFPLFHGGGQENGLRSGTENVAGNVAFVRALRISKEKEKTAIRLLRTLNSQLRQGLDTIKGPILNSPLHAAPHILHISIPGLKPETVIHAMFKKGFAMSTQSACSSKVTDKSRVLDACGKSEAEAVSGLRISMSYETTADEVTAFLVALSKTIGELKQIIEVDNHGI